jgi:hypothetical protein
MIMRHAGHGKNLRDISEMMSASQPLYRSGSLASMKRAKAGCMTVLALPLIITLGLAAYSSWLIHDRRGWIGVQGELVTREDYNQLKPPRQTRYGTTPPRKVMVTRFKYRYRVDGQDLYLWSRSRPSSEIWARAGIPVRIYYDPEDPRQATTAPPQYFDIPIFLFGLTFSVALLIIGKITLKPRWSAVKSRDGIDAEPGCFTRRERALNRPRRYMGRYSRDR